MSDIQWPDPQPEPDEERGENPEFHLLPSLARLRAMTPEERQDIVDRIKDWIGDRVEQFRARVREL
jgi:hypothetical protein